MNRETEVKRQQRARSTMRYAILRSCLLVLRKAREERDPEETKEFCDMRERESLRAERSRKIGKDERRTKKSKKQGREREREGKENEKIEVSSVRSLWSNIREGGARRGINKKEEKEEERRRRGESA